MATPFINERFTFTQPDGTPFEVVGSGNQHGAVFEHDGFTVVKGPTTGYFEYATLSDDGRRLTPSGLRVLEVDPRAENVRPGLRAAAETRRADAAVALRSPVRRRRWEERRAERLARAQAVDAGPMAEAAGPDAPVGTYVGLCVLVQFPDVPGTITRAQVENFCNQHGYTEFGNNGSVRDYFHEVSDGKLTYTNQVTAYFTTSKDRSYYTDPSQTFGMRARELIVEALDHLEANNFDFSNLTTDSDDFVYALNVFYAGDRVNNWSEGLWPHQWSLADPYRVDGGGKLYDYQITNMGDRLTLRTFCHENGHMVCSYPDLYDYGGESHGVGHYSLMCYGGSDTNPVQVDAYLKHEAGWASSVTELSPGQTYTVPAGSNDFLLHARDSAEYFIIENRARTGRDAALPDAGLAIWHVDENGSNNHQDMTPARHYELSLEQADAQYHLERQDNPGDGDDLYGAPGAGAFGAGTSPASAWWNGSPSGLEIEDISAPGPTMTLRTQGNGTTEGGVTGTWHHMSVDWRCDGTTGEAGPFTFEADGTWHYAHGGGRWFQVGDSVAWTFHNATGLVYAAHVTPNAMTGVMGYLRADGPTGCFQAQRTASAPSVEALAAALRGLLGAEGRADPTSPDGGGATAQTDDPAVSP